MMTLRTTSLLALSALALTACPVITEEDCIERTGDPDCYPANADDADGDGFGKAADCDDNDPAVYPGAPEVYYDGVDQDCAGDNDYDRDGDGHAHADYGGDDCDDGDADTYPGAPDDPYDDIINDCDGADEFDSDGDGYDSADYGGDDCDDNNSDVHPGADDEPYDGLDADCDGADEFDLDGDGYDAEPWGEDCDDADAGVHPGHPEDEPGVDNDCDGNHQPEASAGISSSSTERVCDALLLTSAGSDDADDDELAMAWTLVDWPATSTRSTDDLDTPTSANPSFIPDVIGDYRFRLVVDDGLSSDSAEVTASISNRSNQAPVAEAGSKVIVSSSAPANTPCPTKAITLDGTASSDGDGDGLSYSWTITDGPGSGASWSATLTDSTTATPTLTLEDVKSLFQGSYAIETVTVELTVTDCMGDSHSDTVAVEYQCLGT